MKALMKWYFDDLFTVLLRPIYFYTFMEDGPWKDKPLSFITISCWIFSFILSIAAFIISVYPMVAVLITGFSGIKLLVVIPVFASFCVVLFLMIFIIVLFLITAFLIALFSLFAILVHYFAGRFGGIGDIRETVKAVFYSSAVLVPVSILPLFALLARFKVFSSQNFGIAANMVIFLAVIYLWGLWSIAVRKVYKLSKQNVLLSTFIVSFLVILLQVVVGTKIVSMLERWTI